VSSGPGRLRPTDDIRFADVDNLIVILDFIGGDCHVLDPAATALWRNIVSDHDSDNDPASREKFASDCISRGLLTTAPKSDRPRFDRSGRALPGPLTVKAWIALAGTAFSLRYSGLRRTYGALLRTSYPDQTPADPMLLRRAIAAFEHAENAFRFSRAPDDCLPRSLALYRYLRSLGLPAVHVIGARRVPIFSFHAWVEVEGTVVLDDVRVKEKTPIACLPSAAD
jgi:hypothetical protein